MVGGGICVAGDRGLNKISLSIVKLLSVNVLLQPHIPRHLQTVLTGVTLQAFDLYTTIKLVKSSFAPHNFNNRKEGTVLLVDLITCVVQIYKIFYDQ